MISSIYLFVIKISFYIYLEIMYLYKKNLVQPIEVNRELGIKRYEKWNEGADPRGNLKKGFLVKKMEEFCRRTDLHGYKYIVMRDLTILERSCWAVAVIVSIVFAVYFVLTAYHWYARNPIVTVIESTHGAIWDVPFPAVTVCNVNTVSRTAAWNFSRTMHLPDNITAEQVFDALSITPLLHSTFTPTESEKSKLTNLQAVLDLNDININKLFKMLSPVASCKDLVQRCMWKNTIYRCELLFHMVYTRYGLCCTFNYYALASDSDRNISELVHPPTPRRVASCGYQTALTVLLHNNPADYYSAAVASYGSMIFIDNAYNFPDVDSPKRLLNPTNEMFIALTPERTYATSGIRAFPPDQRQCFFKDEVKLGVFSHYTYHNCMLHRRIKLMEQTCDCVPYFFPTKGYTRRCNYTDLECLESVRKPLTASGPIEDGNPVVQCLPDCEHFDYPIEVALGQLAEKAPLEGLIFFKDMDLTNRSLLNVFFNDLVSTRYRRDVYLNWQNLLASFGGLLSLMLGFTLISAIDLVIFFTLRLAYDIICSVRPDSRTAGPSLKRWPNNQIYVTDLHRRDNWF